MRGGEFFDWIEALPVNVKGELLQGSPTVCFPKDAIIYERMAEAKGIYRLLEGRVRLFLMRDTGSVLLLKICEPGETIGDLASVDGHPFPVFAEAMTDVKTSFIKASHFNAMRGVHPQINAALVTQIASSVRGVISLLDRVTMHSIEKQIAGRLQWLKRSQDMRTGKSGPITISQNDLGLMIGASRQTVNKALAKLEARGLINKHYGTITVLDDEALEQFLTRQRP